MDHVVERDNDEIELLCLALDANGTPSPVFSIGWETAWQEGSVTSADVIKAARAELGFEC